MRNLLLPHDLRHCARALLVCLTLCVVVLPASAREVIESFDIVVEVQSDGDLIVTEAITVRAEGIDIRRGIYRDFPTRSVDERGLRREAGFDLLTVERNGRPEPHHVKRTGNGVRIYIGEEDVFIPRTTHRYTIRYRTSRQLRQFEDFDEVYWNMTGNQWVFPIMRVSARVVLPEGATVLQQAGYTGRFGETGDDYRTRAESARSIVFETTRPLAPGEGLTVAVAFPKGLVPGNAQSGTLFDTIWANAGIGALGAGFLAVFGMLFSAWRRVGVDPAPQPIIPRFSAPQGLSPGAVAFLFNQGFRKGSGGHHGFSAAMTSMAVKGRVVIDKSGDTLSLESASAPLHVLSEDERAIDSALLSSGRFDFTRSAGPTLVTALNSFYGAIRKPMDGVYFDSNRGYTVLGVMMSVACLVAFVVIDKPGEETILRVAFTAIPSVVAAILLFKAHELWTGRKGASRPWFALFLVAIALIPLGIVGLILAISLHSLFFVILVLLIVALVAVNAIFADLMPVWSEQGRRFYEQIQGYRLYLSVAEAERMKMVDAPDLSVSVFEEHLPYAIALGVADKWSEAFATHLTRAGEDASYTPTFYRGRYSGADSLTRDIASMSRTMGSAISSSMPAPKSSSSGSSGGGFSGGGGGGGGGGGW
ncbi:MAG: DUF2207 domain-containing protein [Pseudomonadota bacterium]